MTDQATPVEGDIVERLAKFAREIISDYCWGHSTESDGGSVQDLAEGLGLIEPHVATAEDAKGEVDFEPGDTIYKFAEWLTTPAPASSDGWQIAPKEPTYEMQLAGEKLIAAAQAAMIETGEHEEPNADEIYRAMLAAAPIPPIQALSDEGLVEGEQITPSPTGNALSDLMSPRELADALGSERRRREALEAAILPFVFRAYPDRFKSEDGGCTEAIIEDADVQRVRKLVSF